MVRGSEFIATKRILKSLTTRFGIIYCPDCLGLIQPGDKVYARSNGTHGKRRKFEQRPKNRQHFHKKCYDRRYI